MKMEPCMDPDHFKSVKSTGSKRKKTSTKDPMLKEMKEQMAKGKAK